MAVDIKLAFDILAFSSVMVLIVLGLGVIASMMGIFNFAHGEFVLLGAYTVYLSSAAAWPPGSAYSRRRSCSALVGLVMERIIIRRFYAAPIIAMLGTYAIGLVIREIVRGLLGRSLQVDRTSRCPAPSRSAASISRSGGRHHRDDAGGASPASWWMLARTSFGLHIRGALENPMLARACGISTTRLYALTFAFGSALAGLAGALIVPLYQLSADIGIRFLVQAFLSVMLGGVGTFEGPVLGRRGRRHGGRAAVAGHPGPGRSAGVPDRAR